ncbi:MULTISPECIES: DUF1906 domain-containing protein [Streptomyces]|nr:DUF1906 domain-containing protein [Streptomyces viridochromogenes]
MSTGSRPPRPPADDDAPTAAPTDLVPGPADDAPEPEPDAVPEPGPVPVPREWSNRSPSAARRRPGVRAAVAALMAAVAGAALLTAPASAGTRPGAPAPAPAPTPAYYVGKAFDTCEAPSLAVMKAWRSSSYGAVGIYFGGRGRGCPGQRELSRAWVTSVHDMGWRLLPLFVGSQAPCVIAPAKRKYAIGTSPSLQGTQEAGDAVRAARALGIGAGSPLYLDIEAYRRDDARCVATTLSFVRAWNREVRRLGYVPGFYSSADSGVRDMEAQRKAGTKDLPSVMWFARWRGSPSLYVESSLHPTAWTPHARIHQYVGDVAESHGGRSLQIDRSAVDAPVAVVTTAPTP